MAVVAWIALLVVFYGLIAFAYLASGWDRWTYGQRQRAIVIVVLILVAFGLFYVYAYSNPTPAPEPDCAPPVC